MSQFNSVLKTVRQSSPILYGIVWVHILLALVCIVGLFFDDRTLMGLNVWVKPLKFALSGAIYILTVGFLITFYPFSTKKKNWVNTIVAWTLLFEIAIIVLQAARGILSHYNYATPTDALLFLAMGILIGINVVIMFFFIVETIRLKMSVSKSVQWAILWGWCIVFFGSWVGGQMIGQLAHGVGVADGGAGLPLLNWSTVGGDLRVAHFFGLHGLQVAPLFAYFLERKWNTSQKNLLVVITIFAVLYAGWIGFTFYQAKQGIPVI